MKPKVLVLLAAIGSSCSEPELSNIEYNKGRKRAEIEGCHCNSALPLRADTAIDRQGKGWANGYVDACVRFRRERDC